MRFSVALRDGRMILRAIRIEINSPLRTNGYSGQREIDFARIEVHAHDGVIKSQRAWQQLRRRTTQGGGYQYWRRTNVDAVEERG